MSALLAILAKFIAPALLPIAQDAGRAVIARIAGDAGAQPQNIAERIQLMQASTAQLQALAQLDAPAGNISVWVADLRASFRYIAIGLVELAAIGAVLAGNTGPGVDVLLDLAGAGMSFIVGERMYLYVRRR